jgi:hypothetical protein
MWQTPHGKRVLEGDEWRLFREGLEMLWDLIEDAMGEPELAEVGIAAFDRLREGPKLALLAAVGRALSDPSVPGPNGTADADAAVAATYRVIADEVVAEIERADDPDRLRDLDSPDDVTHWRRLVLAADREVRMLDDEYPVAPSSGDPADVVADEEDEDWVPTNASSRDTAKWELLVDYLAHRILWDDEDFLDGEFFLDLDPDAARRAKAQLGIAEGYYTAVAPDPTDRQLEAVRRTLRELSGRPDPHEP